MCYVSRKGMIISIGALLYCQRVLAGLGYVMALCEVKGHRSKGMEEEEWWRGRSPWRHSANRRRNIDSGGRWPTPAGAGRRCGPASISPRTNPSGSPTVWMIITHTNNVIYEQASISNRARRQSQHITPITHSSVNIYHIVKDIVHSRLIRLR